MAAGERAGLKRNPFHPFATFDTAALSGLVLGQTVLAKACIAAGMPFDSSQAHSALYDTEQTALLFASWLTAGNVSAAGRCPPAISPNKPTKGGPVCTGAARYAIIASPSIKTAGLPALYTFLPFL